MNRILENEAHVLESFQKTKPYLIAVDSDGCVLDNMTLKHQGFFFPLVLEVFGFVDTVGDMRALWTYYNLDYPHRGTNRFVALYEFFKTYRPLGGDEAVLSGFAEWLDATNATSQESLENYVKTHNDPLCALVLQWSQKVNEGIQKDLGDISLFPYAKEALAMMGEKADVVVVSSANTEAVNREWHHYGLRDYVQCICSQKEGSKSEILASLINKGYETNRVLMIGDALGDYKAAKAHGAHFYEITYKKEEASWHRLVTGDLEAFFNNTYQFRDQKVLGIAMADAIQVIGQNVHIYTDHFQHVSEGGVYPLEENKLWTMGFYPGQLYLAYDYTKSDYFLSHREHILKSFEERCDYGHMDTHDIGFLYEMTAYYDYKVTKDPKSQDLFLRAANQLMKRYHKHGGYIQAWGPMDQGDSQTRIIIDCMMNLPLLYLATKMTGDTQYADAAKTHAMVTSKTLIRDDYTSYHTYWMSTETGRPLYGATHQGHRDESTWARGQAWAIYGFYKSYEHTGYEYFMKVATRCADVFIDNLPQNDICYWDFDFTDDHPDIRDSSAAAIAASGLLKIGLSLGPVFGKKYTDVGKGLLYVLANRYQNNRITKGCGIIKEGMYHRDHGARAYTSWGDYYYVEALSTFFNEVQEA